MKKYNEINTLKIIRPRLRSILKFNCNHDAWLHWAKDVFKMRDADVKLEKYIQDIFKYYFIPWKDRYYDL